MSDPLRKRLEAIVAGMPEGSAVTLPVDWVRRLLALPEAENRPETGVGASDRPLRLSEVAKRYGRATSTIRGWCVAGKFPGAFKMNGVDWWVPRSALREFEAAQQRDQGRQPVLGRNREADLGAWRRLRQ